MLAVIPTYRPPDSVAELIDSLTSQVVQVLISDDASPCTFDPLLRNLTTGTTVNLLRHRQNHGIARGLNDGLELAHANSFTWLLTIDQDSHIGAAYVSTLLRQASSRVRNGEHLGAIGAETIRDTAGELNYPTHHSAKGPTTEELIQTGTLWSVPALMEIGGFDESLGIDAVDAAACLRLREQGYAIAIAPGISVEHSIGAAQMVPFLGRTVMVTDHSPARRTSMLRNRLRLFPAELRQSPTHAVRTIRRVVTNQTLGLALEDQRLRKALGTLRGLLPGRSSNND